MVVFRNFNGKLQGFHYERFEEMKDNIDQCCEMFYAKK